MTCTSTDCQNPATEHFDVYADGEYYDTAHKCEHCAVVSKNNIKRLGWTVREGRSEL